MMKTIVRKPTKTIFYGTVLAAAVLLITLLAASFAGGPVRAQTPPDRYPNLSTYPDPQPCGPGAGTAFMQEPHEITTGHYALFDAYWRTIKEGANVGGMDVPGVGVLHTNECPPEMVATTTTQGFETVEVSIRSTRNGGMDIEEAIMHVLDTHLATTSETSTSTGYLSLAEYPAVRNVAPAGSQVWWLRLDDPNTTSTDETSDLGIGFSTLLLDNNDWYREDEDENVLKPLRYRFEVERHPTNPGDVPHFFAYEAPKADGTAAELVWDSANAGEDVMELNPGEYKALQWVFTEPGTYLLWVHLLGDVRDEDHKLAGAGADWKPISASDTETSEVYRYTIQVGSDLDETEPPIFGVNLSVQENVPGGTKVGDPIPVYNADAGVLYYDLTGPGHSNFKLDMDTTTKPHTAQIVVAEGASLDYETKKSYDLNLSVTDKVDHEDNFNPYPDDVLIVRINLEDQRPGMQLWADPYPYSGVAVGETVNFTAVYEPKPEHISQAFTYQWGEWIPDGGDGKWKIIEPQPGGNTWSVSQSSQTQKRYRVSAVIVTDDPTPVFVHSNYVIIAWLN